MKNFDYEKHLTALAADYINKDLDLDDYALNDHMMNTKTDYAVIENFDLLATALRELGWTVSTNDLRDVRRLDEAIRIYLAPECAKAAQAGKTVELGKEAYAPDKSYDYEQEVVKQIKATVKSQFNLDDYEDLNDLENDLYYLHLTDDESVEGFYKSEVPAVEALVGNLDLLADAFDSADQDITANDFNENAAKEFDYIIRHYLVGEGAIQKALEELA